jgi:hypothetical protein
MVAAKSVRIRCVALLVTLFPGMRHLVPSCASLGMARSLPRLDTSTDNVLYATQSHLVCIFRYSRFSDGSKLMTLSLYDSHLPIPSTALLAG